MSNFTELENGQILSMKTLIKMKYDEAVKSLDVPKLRGFLVENAIIAGGISAAVFHGEPINDIDVLLKSEKAIDIFNDAVRSGKLDDYIEDVNEKYATTTLKDGKLVTARATTLKNKVQIITMHTANARKTFDFIHTMPYLDLKTETYYISRPQFDSIANKILIKNPHPDSFGATEKRIQKFKDRGWTWNEQ